jgi:hypothetical protein
MLHCEWPARRALRRDARLRGRLDLGPQTKAAPRRGALHNRRRTRGLVVLSSQVRCAFLGYRGGSNEN